MRSLEYGRSEGHRELVGWLASCCGVEIRVGEFASASTVRVEE